MSVVKVKGTSRNIKVSYFERKGLYRKYVGGRMFYLGPDKFTARKLAAVILTLRAVRKVKGEDWQEEDLEFIRMAKDQLYRGVGRVVLKWGDQRFELEHGSRTRSGGRGERSRSPDGTGGGVLTVGEAMAAFKSQLSSNPLVPPRYFVWVAATTRQPPSQRDTFAHVAIFPARSTLSPTGPICVTTRHPASFGDTKRQYASKKCAPICARFS